MKKNGFGERLKALLKQKGLTQGQVASSIGTSVPSVNRWTKGGEIEYENLRSLADFLEVNWVWLRYGDEAIESLKTAEPENGPMRDLRREYLDQILENEARMKAALGMAQIITWEWNVLTRSVTCSDNATQLFGVSEDHLPNCMLPFTSLAIDELIDTFGNGQPYNWDFEVTDDLGQKKWFSSRAELIFDSAKRPIKVIGISADITERKHAENALAHSEYVLKKIIDIIPVGLWLADKEGKINLANPEVQRIWGGAKYVGLSEYGEYKGWWEDSGEPLTAEDWTLARAVTAGETSKPQVVDIEAFDGEKRTIVMHAAPLRNTEEEIIGAVEINQDITNLKAIERSLKQSLLQWQAVFDQEQFSVIQLDENLEVKVLSKKLLNQLSISSVDTENLSLERFLTDNVIDLIREKLKSSAENELTTFSVSQETDKVNQEIYVLHDERQNITPMTLLFILD